MFLVDNISATHGTARARAQTGHPILYLTEPSTTPFVTHSFADGRIAGKAHLNMMACILYFKGCYVYTLQNKYIKQVHSPNCISQSKKRKVKLNLKTKPSNKKAKFK